MKPQAGTPDMVCEIRPGWIRGAGQPCPALSGLQHHPVHPHRRRRTAALQDEGKVADPELVVAAGGTGATRGAERATEEVVAVAAEAGLLHGALQGGGVGLQQHGAQVGLLQGSGDTAQHLGFVSLHIHLPQQQRGAGSLKQLIEAGEGHLHGGLLAGGGEQGNGAVGGVAAGGEAHRSLRGPHGQATGVHAAEQIVEVKVAQPPLEGGGDGFEGKRAGLGNATGNHRAGARGARRPCRLLHGGRSRNSWWRRSCRFRSPARWHPPRERSPDAQQAADELPTQETGHGAGQIVAGEGVAQPVSEQRGQLGNGTER